MVSRRTAVAVSLMISLSAAAPSRTAATEIWIGPMGVATDQYTFTFELAAKGQHTLKSIKAIEMYLQPLIIHYSNAQLEALAKTITAHDIQFVAMTKTINTSYCVDKHSLKDLGEKSAQDDFMRLKVWFEAGGSLSALALDGPEKLILYQTPCREFHPDLATAAEIIVSYMTTMKSLIGGLGRPVPKFHLVVNFPNWNYAGIEKSYKGLDYQYDYKDVLETIYQTANSHGVRIDGIEIDNPSPSPMGLRLRLLYQQAKRLGLKVGMIFNTYRNTRAVGPSSCSAEQGCVPSRRDYMPPDDVRELTFMLDMLGLIKKWRSEVGELPDYSIIETWMMHPRAILPETTLGTLTYDVLAAKSAIEGSIPPILNDLHAPIGCWAQDGSRIFGWARDPDDPTTSIYVHIYGAANPDQGRATAGFIASVAANLDCAETDCSSLVRDRHAFAWPVTPQWSEKEHKLYVYAVDASPTGFSASRSLVPLASSNCSPN